MHVKSVGLAMPISGWTSNRRRCKPSSDKHFGHLQLSLIDLAGVQGVGLSKDVAATLVAQLCFLIGCPAAAHTMMYQPDSSDSTHAEHTKYVRPGYKACKLSTSVVGRSMSSPQKGVRGRQQQQQGLRTSDARERCDKVLAHLRCATLSATCMTIP